MPSLKHHGQMSEAFITALFLSVSGGLQDVYTYLFRGKVFANAQTGNIVLMSVHAFAGEWGEALRYLVPLCAFALGIFAAEFIRLKLREMQWLHWRQLVVLFEILLLFVVGFLPQELNLLANSIVSFSCAMQVQAFRKVNGYAFASTMCIGNLRSGMDSLCAWLVGGNAKAFGKAVHYFAIIFLFALGAGIGSVALLPMAGRAIWLSCLLLGVSFCLMFLKEDIEALVAPTVDANVFQLGDKVLRGDFNGAMAIVDDLLFLQERPESILTILTMSFVDYYRAAAVRRAGVADATARKELGYGGSYRFTKALEQCGRLSRPALEGSLEILADADARMKQSAADGRTVLEVTILRLIELLRRERA